MRMRYAPLLALLLAPAPLALHAQDAQPVTRLSRLLSHYDLGVAGTAFFTKDVTGTVAAGTTGAPYSFTQSASSAAGVIATLRGQKSPYKGFELNYSYGRISEKYSCCNLNTTTGSSTTSTVPFQSQATANEYTVGYLARPAHPIFGFQPFVSVGAGVFAFKPTANGGQGLQTQARAAYYYSVGGEDMITPSFGVRAGVRQLFYKAPDFGQNYLKINKMTFTIEPEVGIFVRF